MGEESPPIGGDALDGFSPATRAWFDGAFAEPTQAQAGAWQTIGKGEDTLVVAPTGSGKTLAAFLWAIDRLAALPPPEDPKRRCRVLYVSPLKALAVDIERNLRAPLTGIRHAAHRLGLAEPDIRVALRTGDTAAEDRRKLLSKPPDILITTPESLFLLLTSQARETLRAVETVIVDEVHAVAGNKRGAHLALSLERLDALLPRPAQRVGLSATVRPVEEVATFLGGARAVAVVQPPSLKRIELKVVVPVEDMTELDTVAARGADGDEDHPAPARSIWPHVEERVLDLIEQHKSTIVFANSRRLAERLCGRLNELAAERAEAAEEARLSTPRAGAPARMPAEVMAQAGSAAGAPAEVARAHHGSVSRQERAEIEEALKAGRLPAVVATSSLELGIDMGAVDLVVQVEAPPSVASGLQRVGRAGHNVGDVSRGVIFPKYQGDLVQSAVVAERMADGRIEELKIPRNPLDVLAQQVVAMTAMDDWPVDELERTARKAAAFSGLTRPVLEAVLDMLSGRYPSEDFAGLRPRIIWDRVAGIIRARPGAQRIAVTSGGTIPDRGLFGVFLASDTSRQPRRVGELDEEMVYESRVGDVFVLGASSWRIEDITPDRVLVTPAPGQPGRLPFWHGDTPGRPAELGRAIGAACRELTAMMGAGEAGGEAEAAAKLEQAGLDELAARNLIRYLADQRAATGYVPDDRTLVVERFRDELGDWRVVLHSPYGDRVHAPWALAIAARLRERYGGMDVQALHTDDGILIRVPDSDEPPPSGIALLDPEEIGDLVTAEVGASALFASRFRECASRALLLPRRQPGRRTPLWQQRQRSAQLLEIASRYPAFPIVLETVRECLRDVFDVPALTGLLRDIAARRIRVVEVDTATPSPFGKSLLFRYVGAFMYEGDAPLAERRAQALSLDPALLAELLGQDGLRELLDPAVVGETERDLQHLSEARRCRDAEGVFDLLRTAGPLTGEEVAERCVVAGAAADWLGELSAARRIIQVRIARRPMWAAIEDAGRLRDALGVPLPLGVPEAFTEPVADPLGDLVARYARTHGPFGAAAVAGRYGLGIAVMTMALRRLAADGRVVEGEFLPARQAGANGASGTEWCDAEVLRLLRRRCLARLRKEAEPVPQEVLAQFLPAWHGIGGYGGAAGRGAAAGSGGDGRRRADAGAVLEAVERLAGAPVPASALETLVLPGRVPGYSPALLDELTSAGEVVWSGAGALPGGDGWLVLAPADGAELMLPEPGEVSMTALHSAVLEVLGGGGALFFRMLSDRVAALLGRSGTQGVSLPDDGEVAAAIWDLVWAGLLTNDTLAPLRVMLGGQQRRAAAPARTTPRPRPGRPGRRYGFGRPPMPTRSGPPTVSGRWSLLPGRQAGDEADGGSVRDGRDSGQTVRAHALALTLLERHGVLTRGAVASERVPGGFAAVYPVLRAMEEAGQCRRGYFVEGLGAAQFALPGAVDRMRAMAKGGLGGWVPPGAGGSGGSPPRAGTVLAAADPAQPYGAALAWPDRPGESPSSHRPGRKAGALVVLVDGSLVLYVERGGRTLLSWTEDPELLGPSAAALAASVRDGALGRLTVERADGLTVGVHDSPLAQALEAAGFRPTPRGLRLRAG
jgi:ATP-dependent helicase Lhr and Lhr-like helicase